VWPLCSFGVGDGVKLPLGKACATLHFEPFFKDWMVIQGAPGRALLG